MKFFFFRADTGHDCNRRWNELARPGDLVVVAMMQANVLVALLICCRLLRQSRETRSKDEPRASMRHHRSFGAQPRADGRDFFHWKTYNDYERCVIWVGLAIMMLIFSFADVNGSEKVYPWWLRQANHGLVRWFFDLSLFQMCSAYRTTLTGKRDKGLLVAGSASLVLQAVTAIMEQAAVPRRGRLGCWNNYWNFARNFGSALIETGFIIASVRFALKVRNQFKQSLAHSNYVRNQLIIRGIVMRILMIGGICFCALVFGIYVGFRNAGIYTCSQPICSLTEFLRTALWGIAYVVVTWYATIFLCVGSPLARKKTKSTTSKNYFSRPAAIIRSDDRPPARLKREESFFMPLPILPPSKDAAADAVTEPTEDKAPTRLREVLLFKDHPPQSEESSSPSSDNKEDAKEESGGDPQSRFFP